MNKLLLFCSASLLSLPAYAQQLSIASKHKTKTFPTDTHFELGILLDKPAPDDYSRIFGKINQVTNDSLSIQVIRISQQKTMLHSGAKETVRWPAMANTTTVAKNQVLYLRDYKSVEAQNRRGNRSALGGILLFTGLTTIVHGLILDDADSKNILLISGGIQFTAGIGFTAFNKTKKYRVGATESKWQLQ